MKKCTSCQMEIDDKAKICPHCQTKQGNWIRRHPILTVIIGMIIFLVVIGASSGNNKTTKVSESTPQVISQEETATTTPQLIESPTPQKSEFSIGETIQMKDYVLTVNNVDKALTKGYSKPKTGNQYVIVNVTIQNQGDTEVSYNALDFKIQDSNGNQTTTTFVSLDDQLNSGSLAANGKVTGSLAFEAPKGDTGLKLIYQPNYFIDNQRITVNLQ